MVFFFDDFCFSIVLYVYDICMCEYMYVGIYICIYILFMFVWIMNVYLFLNLYNNYMSNGLNVKLVFEERIIKEKIL